MQYHKWKKLKYKIIYCYDKSLKVQFEIIPLFFFIPYYYYYCTNFPFLAVHSHRKSTIFHAKMDINSLFGKNSLIRSMKGIILQQTDGGYAAAAAVDPCCHNSTSTKFQHNQTRHSLLNSRF